MQQVAAGWGLSLAQARLLEHFFTTWNHLYVRAGYLFWCSAADSLCSLGHPAVESRGVKLPSSQTSLSSSEEQLPAQQTKLGIKCLHRYSHLSQLSSSCSCSSPGHTPSVPTSSPSLKKKTLKSRISWSGS